MEDVDELVGLWDSAPFEYGSMEASQLALLADGTGWAVLANAARGMEMTLLDWRRLDVHHFAISEKQIVSGSWDPDRPGCLVCDEPAMPLDDRSQFRYELVTEVPPLAESPMRVLKLDAWFHFAQSYALTRRDGVEADRPRVVTSA